MESDPIVSIAYNYLFELIHDSTPVVLKSICEAMRLCLPMLLLSSQPARGIYFVC